MLRMRTPAVDTLHPVVHYIIGRHISPSCKDIALVVLEESDSLPCRTLHTLITGSSIYISNLGNSNDVDALNSFARTGNVNDFTVLHAQAGSWVPQAPLPDLLNACSSDDSIISLSVPLSEFGTSEDLTDIVSQVTAQWTGVAEGHAPFFDNDISRSPAESSPVFDLGAASLGNPSSGRLYHGGDLPLISKEASGLQGLNEPSIEHTMDVGTSFSPLGTALVQPSIQRSRVNPPTVYFLSENIIYCFHRGGRILSMVISNEARANYLPVPGVPSPAPPEFNINGYGYAWFDFGRYFLLEVHDERPGTQVPVALFEELSQARHEQGARTASMFPASYDFQCTGASVMESLHPASRVAADPQTPPLERNDDENLPPVDASDSTSNTADSSLSGSQSTDSPRSSSSSASRGSIQPQEQHESPYRLNLDASKSDIDEYCAKLKRGGYRNTPCPFCHGKQDRVSGLKRHLYSRFRVDEHACEKGCGQKFSLKDNEKRHSKKCEGFPKSQRSAPEPSWVPHCKPSTKARLRRDRNFASGKPYN